MILISANPYHAPKKRKTATARKAKSKGASAMAKKRRSAAQRAATARMIAANKRGRKTHHNPTKTKRRATSRRRASVHHNPTRRRSVRRNPSMFSGGGVLGELLSKDGLIMVGAAFAAPMATDYLQEKIMPSATGWTKVAVKAGLVAAGAWAIDKFLKQRKAALAYAVTGAAVVASDAVQIARGVMAGLSASEADMLANRPDLIQAVANGGLGGAYEMGLSGPYQTGLAEDSPPSAFNNPFQSAF